MANIDNPVAEMAPDGFYRVALGVEYKGSRYSGWQRQLTGVATVQEELEKALSKVANSPVSCNAPGVPTPACMPAAKWCTSTLKLIAR